MAIRRRESPSFLAWASVVTITAAVAFYSPARAACAGDWPVPLDDVFIHYDFARAWAEGHPFEWIAGQGYSSGETSPAYAVLLGAGYFVGFRDLRLGYWTALIAGAALVYMMRSLRRLTSPAPTWVATLAAPLLLVSGILDFAWFSGMEVALFGAVAAALLVAVEDARTGGPVGRPARQWRVGLLGALLVLVRPEAAIVVAVATFVVARRCGAFSPLAACVRVALPGALATLSVAAANRVFTGDAASAGAMLKLLSSNPFTTDEQRARDYVVNLAAFGRAMAMDLGGSAGHAALLVPLLALSSLTHRRTRALGVVCLGGSFAYVLLVSWNGAARFQNFRDYMPPFALFLFAAVLGLRAIAARPRLGALGVAGALLGIAVAAPHIAEGSRFYARAARNIHDQQVTVGRRLSREPANDTILLVGDAGAIPYVSGLHAIDAVGLGGYHARPFVHAAVEGEGGTLELIERLPLAQRPTILALYPNWFPGITGRFGRERERVTITDNVICGGVTKGIYEADWSALMVPADVSETEEWRDSAVLDEIDIADVVSEAAHAYTSPAPRGGWTLFDVRTTALGTRRFDAGRVIPDGQEESFALRAPVPRGSRVVLRTDETAATITVYASAARGGPFAVKLVRSTALDREHWALAQAVLPAPLAVGDRLMLRATDGALHDFHAWLVQGKP